MLFKPQESLLYANNRSLGLDASGEVSFVSHAHSDHTSFLRKGSNVLASQATLDLIEARGGRRHESLEIDSFEGLKLSFENAGHVLGARQLVVDSGVKKFVYTGDFNPSDSLTCKGAKPVACDELLIECTYGSSEWVFPNRIETCQEIAKWVEGEQKRGNAVVFGCYSLGKAQEVVAALNEFTGQAPIVTGNVEKVCNVYKRHGVDLDFIGGSGDKAREAYKGAFCAIVPSHLLNGGLTRSISELYRRDVKTAIATGWALNNRFAGVDAAFALSDHADYNGLLDFVKETGAKKVWCKYGFSTEFASDLRKLGLDAYSVDEEHEQTNLVQFAAGEALG